MCQNLTQKVLLKEYHITLPQKTILILFANYADSEGKNIFVSHNQIASIFNISRSCVIRSIKELEKLNYINKYPIESKANYYELNLEKL